MANWVENPAGEAEAIEDIVNQLVQSDAAFQRLWVDLLTIHLKADIPLKVFDSDDDYRRYFADRSEKGSGTVRTLGGIYVRSLQEQQIANWLWLRSVEFEFVTGSITSYGPSEARMATALTENPHLKCASGADHGYGIISLGSGAADVDFMAASDPKRVDASTARSASFSVIDGTPGVQFA